MITVREAHEEDRESTSKLLWKAFEATTSHEDAIKQGWVDRWNSPETECDHGMGFMAYDSYRGYCIKLPIWVTH